MTVGAASESVLGTLHGRVATVMKGALDVYDAEQKDYLERVDQGEPDLIAPQPNASLLSVITKFLADNSITCVPAESNELSALETSLREKRERRSVRNVSNVVPITG